MMVRYNIYTRTLPFYLSPVSAVLLLLSLSLSMHTTHTDQHASKSVFMLCALRFEGGV